MRLCIYVIMLCALCACSANKNVTGGQQGVTDQQKSTASQAQLKVLVADFNAFKAAPLTTEQSPSEETKVYIKRMGAEISKMVARANKLKKRFEGLLGLGRQFENLSSIAYISMLYYHMHDQIAHLQPPSSFDEETQAHFVSAMKERAEPLLRKSKEASKAFKEVCERVKMTSQCERFIESHKDDLPVQVAAAPVEAPKQ